MTSNMIMDNGHQKQQRLAEFQVTVPISNVGNNNNNNDNNSSNNNNNNPPETQISPSSKGKTSLKRSFDVAFLMMPDDRIKQKQSAAAAAADKTPRVSELLDRQHPTDLSPRQQVAPAPPHHITAMQLPLYDHHPELFTAHDVRRFPQITIRSPRIYDDPTLVIPDIDASPVRSAFTKVNARLESPVPPSLSPDQLSCHSISPPISTTPPRSNSRNNSAAGHNVNGGGIAYQSFRPEYQFSGSFQSVNQVQALAAAQNQRLKQHLMYRPAGVPSGGGGGSPPEFLTNYAGFPFANPATHPFVVSQPPEIPGIVRSPAAAAILSTLIPPTLASTFSLTAQNVCAKCNISFRMTSDLVYHMRSHHKSEVACDPNRRKREDKLKCPVCNESFRERHHLTRHMTAHQDKESDNSTPTANGGDNSAHQSRHQGRNTSK